MIGTGKQNRVAPVATRASIISESADLFRGDITPVYYSHIFEVCEFQLLLYVSFTFYLRTYVLPLVAVRLQTAPTEWV